MTHDLGGHLHALALISALSREDGSDLDVLLRGISRHDSEVLILTLALWHVDAMHKAGLDPAQEVDRFRARLLRAEASGL